VGLGWEALFSSATSAAFRVQFPGDAGLGGLVYWYVLYPSHRWIFAGMLRAIAVRAELESRMTHR
jgi:hypothetical protein